MRVALISFDFGEYAVRVASSLSTYATVLLLLAEDEGAPFAGQLPPGVRHVPIPRVRLRQPLRQIRRNGWILQQLRDFGPNVVHLQQGSMWFNIALEFDHSFPLVLTTHDAERHPGDKLSRKTPYYFSKLGFHRADRLIAHNQYVKALLHEKLGIPEKKLRVVPHIQLGQHHGPVDSQDDGRTVLFFGRIWPYKGLDSLILAEPWIAQQIPEVRIVIAGEGEDFAQYRRLMVHPERFLVLNRHISDTEVAEIFSQASVVVLPYIEASQSGVIPIAYTFARPVVGTTVGGLPEMIEDGVTGLLVPPSNVEKLASAIVTILRDDTQRTRMGRAGRRKIELECAPDVIARQTLDVYQSALLTDRKPGQRWSSISTGIVSAVCAGAPRITSAIRTRKRRSDDHRAALNFD
jgi:glycosyltransferase involved in cell wall biosynthesis